MVIKAQHGERSDFSYSYVGYNGCDTICRAGSGLAEFFETMTERFIRRVPKPPALPVDRNLFVDGVSPWCP
jgi:hypothetical protein